MAVSRSVLVASLVAAGLVVCSVAGYAAWRWLGWREPPARHEGGADAGAAAPAPEASDAAAPDDSSGSASAAASGLVRVSAVDAASREAVPGLPLAARRLGEDGEPAAGFAAIRAVTDDAGAAAFSAVPFATYSIASDDEFLASRFLSLRVALEQPSAEGVLEIVPGGRITGRVVNPAGVPLAGATVRAAPDFSALAAIARALREIPGEEGEPDEFERLAAEASFDSFSFPSVETGEDGFFALRGVPAGSRRVAASHPDYLANEAAGPVEVLANLESSAGVIRLTPGAALVVRVEGPSGEGVAGAEVAFEPAPGEGEAEEEGAGLPSRAVSGVATLTSGADGIARLPHGSPGRYRLHVTHALHPPAAPLEVDLVEGLSSEVTVRLEAGLTLDGAVFDEAGRFVPGAIVGLRQEALFRETKTGAAGAFAFAGLAAKPARLTVRAEEYASLENFRAEPGRNGLRIVLRRGGRLAGRVIAPDGTAASEFRIEVRTVGGGTFFAGSELRTKDFTGAEDGAFEMSGLPGGRYRVTATAGGVARATGESAAVDLPDDGEVANVEIRLEASRTVRGRVVAAATRDPVEGARVRALRESPPAGAAAAIRFAAEAGAVTTVKSGADGAFSIEVEPGAKVLVAAAKGYVASSAGVPPEGSFDEVEIELRPGGRVEGTVFDGRGAPLEGARVVLMSGITPARIASTAPDGSFTMEAVEPGEFTGGFVPRSDAEADSPDLDYFGSLRDTKPVVVRDGETTRADFGGAGRSGARIHGYVVVGGKAARGVEVFLVPGSGGAREANFAEVRRTQADGEGFYEFADLGRGRYTVGADFEGSTIFEKASIAENPDVRLDLVAPDGTVVVRVADAKTREPLADVSVFLVPEGTGPILSLGALADGGFWQRTTNDAGEAKFEHLRGGRYDVSAGEAEPFGGGSGSAHAIERAEAALEEGGEARVELLLRPGLVLEGQVTGPDGEGVPAPIVSLFDERGRPASGLFPMPGHDDGSYRLAGLAPGTYVARVSARGYAPAERGNVRVDRSEGNRADFTLGPGGTLDVEVVDSKGEPLAFADVRIVDAAGRSVVEPVSLVDSMAQASSTTGTPPTDESGRTRREHLSPGRYVVTASIAGERESAPVAAVVRERETAAVRVIVP